MAGLGGTIDADFAEFVGECQKADAGLAQIQAQAKKTEVALDEMTTSASPGQMSDNVSKTGAEMAKVDGSANQMIGTMRSLAGAVGVAFSVEAVIGFGKEILRTADEITRLADQTGLSVEEVQRLSYTAGQAGNTLDQITQAASKMQASLDTEKGQKAVEALGIEFRQFAAEKPYDQLLQVSDALRGIPDPTERAQHAVELFGESGAKILPTLASDMRAVGEAAAVSSAEQIAALDAAGDAIDRWATTAKTAAVGAAGGILLAGEQIADQGLLKTIQMWANSPTTAIFVQQMTAIRTAAKQTAAEVAAADAAVAGAGGGSKETPAERAARERAEANAKREHEAAAKALATAEAELKNVRLGYGGNLASMSAETLKAVQADLELGASQSAVATAYGLTAQQVKAASEELKTHLKITTGLGAEWANVGEKVTITAKTVIADSQRMTAEAAAYEAETRRMVDEAQKIAPPIAAAEEETKQLTVAFQQASSAIRMTAAESIEAGKVLEQAYRDAGIFVGQQIATGGYQQSQRLAAGREITGAGQTWGNTLNVNVNSTDAQDIAGKLVGEMRRSGYRL